MQHNFNKTIILLFFLFFIHTNGKAQLCIDFTTSYELDRCFEQEIEKRISAFNTEHGFDFEEIRLAFNTYLVKAGFTTADSIGVGYRNFLRQLYAPVDKTELISTLDSDFLQHLMSMIRNRKLRNIRFLEAEWYIYLGREFGDFFDIIEKRCINDNFRDADGKVSETCPLIQIVESTLYYKHLYLVFDIRVRGHIIPFLLAHKETWAKEVYEKPIYQFYYLSLLYEISYLNRIINGEAIFSDDFLDNGKDIEWRIVVNSEYISGISPIEVSYIYTPTGELKDVSFFSMLGKIEYNEVCENIRNAFRNSTFIVGIFEGRKVKYAGRKRIDYR